MEKDLFQYTALAKFLKDALGERYSVALVSADDLKQEWTIEDRSLIKISKENGMERKLLADILISKELKKQDYICSFSETGSESAIQRSSVFLIRNKKGDIIAFLCIDEKETNRVTVKEVLDQMLGPNTLEPNANSSQHISEEVDAFMREYISENWSRYKTPGKRLKKADKLAFVNELMENGFFRMKGAAIQISKVTGISIASIYRYLAEVMED